MLFGCLREAKQLLADQIVHGVFQPESTPHTASSPAVFFPDLVALHKGDYTGTMCWPPSADSQKEMQAATEQNTEARAIVLR
jgi:hypothetical protein